MIPFYVKQPCFSWRSKGSRFCSNESSLLFSTIPKECVCFRVNVCPSCQAEDLAKGDDIGRDLSAESIILDEQTLQRDLQIAIEEENYAEAAKIRDDLRLLHDDSKASILGANSRFYDAFRRGDLAMMQNLWAKGDDVCCVYLGANGIVGYDFVMESCEIVWMNQEFPLQIELKNVLAHVRGDFGYVTCMELVKTKGSSWGGQFATIAFERINGQWYYMYSPCFSS